MVIDAQFSGDSALYPRIWVKLWYLGDIKSSAKETDDRQSKASSFSHE